MAKYRNANRGQRLVERCTIHVQNGRMGDRSSRVWSNAGILPGVSRSYRFDGQLFDALSGIGHDHVAVISLYGTAVEGPRDLQRKIAFGHHALLRHQVSGVNGILAEGDRCYLWGDCDTNKKIKYNDSRKMRKSRVIILRNPMNIHLDFLAFQGRESRDMRNEQL